MKKIFFSLVSASLILLLTGCFVSELGSMSGRERIEYLQSIKLYGAHWIKEGMTREMRLQDLESCGNSKSLNPGFSDALIRAETLPTDVMVARSYNKDLIDNPQAEARLGKKRMFCMQSKGYTWLEQCDARCLYP